MFAEGGRVLRRAGRARTAFVLAALLAGVARAAAEPAPGADDWKYDVVYLKKGPPLRGLVLAEGPAYVRIRCISRKPGAPTILHFDYVARAEVERVELLEGEERDLLRRRLETLMRQREGLAAHLKALDPTAPGAGPAGDVLDVQTVPWLADPRARALTYPSAYFRLVSDARPEVVQLAAIQLEQVYAAYARSLPPRRGKGAHRPTTILLMHSLAEYHDYARRQGHNLLNAAYYDPGKNQIICGSDLERLSDELQRIGRYHERLRADLKGRKAELNKVYKGRVPPELWTPILEAEKKIGPTEKRNHAAFLQARDRLFQRLYHEAFHAYLANFVYPPAEGEVPRWLNEGLAQVFETAVFEVGELRVGHANKERLDAVRHALAKGTFLPLPDLLRSGPRQFLAAHAAALQVSDRYYLASWALAYYLTFERKLLGTRALDDYVHALKRGTDPLAAFRALAGEPLTRFENGFREYLKHLRPDGSVGRGS